MLLFIGLIFTESLVCAKLNLPKKQLDDTTEPEIQLTSSTTDNIEQILTGGKVSANAAEGIISFSIVPDVEIFLEELKFTISGFVKDISVSFVSATGETSVIIFTSNAFFGNISLVPKRLFIQILPKLHICLGSFACHLIQTDNIFKLQML